MNKKILATILALGMVLTGVSLLVPADDPTPTPSTMPVLQPLDGTVQCLATDNQNFEFTICGVCDIAVDAEVEIGLVADFAIGAGIQTYVTAQDNYPTGVFRVRCQPLPTGDTTYYYRVAMTNGADTLYWPDSATTAMTVSTIPGTVPANPMAVAQASDRPTGTAQTNFLNVAWVTEGETSFPLSLIGTPFAAFTGNNFRRPSDTDYLQTTGTSVYAFAAGGMWDDGSGMAYWYNNSADGTYVGAPAPFADVRTDKMPEAADQVDIYYTVDFNATWNLLGNDLTPLDGLYAIDLDTLAGPGFFYGWICNANLGDDDVGIPAGGTPWEAGPYFYGGGGMPPETLNLGDAPDPHDGNVVNDYVTLTATIDDSMHLPADNINAAEVRVDGAAANLMSASDGAFDSVTEGVTFDYWFPPAFAEGLHTYEIHGSDVADGWNLTWVSGTFTVTDITAPLGDYLPSSTPDGASRSIGVTAGISCFYEDFTAYSDATIYWWNATEGFRANSAPMTNSSFAWGSYYNQFTAGILVYGAPGDTIFYEIDLSDSSAGGPLTFTLAQRTIIPLAPPVVPQDPYPIYGYTYQYDGTSAGGYAPQVLPGCDVTVQWYNNSAIPAFISTITTTSNALGQYSVDILNYTDLDYVWCNVTVNPVYGNLGYNWTTIDVVGFPGGRWQDIVCGVPYNVTILQPIDGATVYAATPFDIEYIITDRDGLLAPGYFSYVLPNPDGGYVNLTCGPIPGAPHGYSAPVDKVYEGTADPDPGHFFAAGGITIFYPGNLWYINASEGGQVFPDTFYLTQWDAFWLDPWMTIDGWLKDWDNITVNVVIGGFDWLLTQGWNIVSCPQNATYRQGANPFFDAQDALNWTNLYLIANYGVLDANLGMAGRIGGNPSTYNLYDVDTGEAGAFALDTTHGYWVYTSFPGPYIVHFDAQNATTNNPGTNTVDVIVAGGWNLMGWQHNYTGAVGWITIPTASMFTDGTVDTSGYLVHVDLGGGLNKIVATAWTAAKWYDSYVVDIAFPGVAAHNWVWNMFSQNPGNGYWLWVDAGGTMTYSVDF